MVFQPPPYDDAGDTYQVEELLVVLEDLIDQKNGKRVLIDVLQEVFQVLSQLHLILRVPTHKFDQESVALFHENDMFCDQGIFLLSPISNKVDGIVVHVEAPHESLILFVL